MYSYQSRSFGNGKKWMGRHRCYRTDNIENQGKFRSFRSLVYLGHCHLGPTLGHCPHFPDRSHHRPHLCEHSHHRLN